LNVPLVALRGDIATSYPESKRDGAFFSTLLGTHAAARQPMGASVVALRSRDAPRI
jgi:hypothetical protein